MGAREIRASTIHLIENERRFQLLVEAIVDYAIFMLDPEGRIATWNPGAQRIKGYSAAEAIGHHFSCFFAPADREAGVPQKLLAAAREVGRAESEGWRVRKDGSRVWVLAILDAVRDETGALIGFAKITRDMTERKLAQEALTESERRFRLLVEGVSDYAICMLDPGGFVTDWNIGAQRTTGYSSEEIIGQHFDCFYTPEDRAAGIPAHSLAVAAETGAYEAEGWRMRKDGSRFHASVVVNAIRDVGGELIGYGKITRDITERRRAQEALQRAQEQLAQSQKMEALGQLTDGIAHDFNNLLMVVSGHAQILARRVKDPRDQRSIEAIRVAASRGENLTRQLLTFSRRQQLSPTVLDLRDRLGAIRPMLTGSLRGDVALRDEIPADLWPIEVDVGAFELALLNLFVNARDAMPDGGAITLGARNVVLDRASAVDDLEGEYVAICVSDTGCGIPPELVSRVFDPFFTTKSPDKGTGLGLSQVYGFVHQSGGTVTVRSEVGAGTTITLYLPRSRGQPSGSAASAETDPPRKSTCRVLLVEDDAEVAAALTTMLDQLGQQVTVADSADRALDLLRGGYAVDLLLSDVVMAGPMDGIALAGAVRAEFPDLPVLLTSGHVANGRDIPAHFAFLPKPFELNTLATEIAKALERDGRDPRAQPASPPSALDTPAA
ncbi:MAG TPA: PAS domain S-box protein [Xanthobacteraceae bacterium]|nr:PAS domain S-box protein [Xanthobacteraceae bacterium]